MHYLEQIRRFKPTTAEEATEKEVILQHLMATGDRCLDRDHHLYHLTASALIFDPVLEHLLMIHHRIYDTWTWTGGHTDGASDLLALAIQEAKEETGLERVEPLLNEIVSLDILPVPPHHKGDRFVPAHLHLNAAYLLVANPDDHLIVNHEETHGVRWIPVAQVEAYSTEPEILKIYEKMIARAREARPTPTPFESAERGDA